MSGFKLSEVLQAMLFACALAGILTGVLIQEMGFGLLIFLISFALALVLGLPAFVLLSRAKKINVWTTVACGFLIGLIPVSVLNWDIKLLYLMSAGVGSVIAGLFWVCLTWLIARHDSLASTDATPARKA
ncbi:MAG: hypothetical protein WA071_12635 [Undibacterium umbellatum]|uniref:hypothetical protein n=1 Tax=Undibacterium umbellatum TaxID=2762300 RepID=UPI003BB61AEB